MTDLCGYTLVDEAGEQYPCDRTATGWRWYQDVAEHEDVLDAACEMHANEGGRRMAELERTLKACRTLGEIIDRQAIDICQISDVPMPESGDADFELAWSRAFEMADEVERLRADSWDEGYASGASNVRRQWSDEPGLQPTANPYCAALAEGGA